MNTVLYNNIDINKFNLDNIKNIHMIGIGGISMSGIAIMLKKSGFNISGSDTIYGDMVKTLETENIPVYIGHNPQLVEGKELVVYTAAISEQDIEYTHANEIGIPTIERAPFIQLLLKRYSKPICIAGMHGKTTTTSMIASTLKNLNVNPTVLVGSRLKELGNMNYMIGSNEYFVLEACEYVDSFLNFPPQTAIILNIEEEHLDYFSGIEQIKDSFCKFIKLLPKQGNLIINKDDKNCMDVLGKSKEFIENNNINIFTYSITDNLANIFADNIKLNDIGCYSYDLYINSEFISNISLSAPGKHNVMNSMATIGSIFANNLDIKNSIPSINEFTGASRRFEYKKTIHNNVDIYDDYAHHPTELRATLESAKDKSKGRVIVIFQPHMYSRTKKLLDDFANSFYNADIVILTDIYAAREIDDGTISSEMLADRLVENGIIATYTKDFEKIADIIHSTVKDNDIVLTIGAGTITNLSDMLY